MMIILLTFVRFVYIIRVFVHFVVCAQYFRAFYSIYCAKILDINVLI